MVEYFLRNIKTSLPFERQNFGIVTTMLIFYIDQVYKVANKDELCRVDRSILSKLRSY